MVGHIAMAEEEEGGKYEAVGVDRPFGGGNSWAGILRVGERCIIGDQVDDDHLDKAKAMV